MNKANPFLPESDEQLRARFIDATLETFIPSPNMIRPGEDRQHIFDFNDGFRLLISKELWRQGEVIHLSGSIDVERMTMPRETPIEQVLKIFVDKFLFLANNTVPGEIVYLGMHGDKGIPHWYVLLKGGDRADH